MSSFIKSLSRQRTEVQLGNGEMGSNIDIDVVSTNNTNAVKQSTSEQDYDFIVPKPRMSVLRAHSARHRRGGQSAASSNPGENYIFRPDLFVNGTKICSLENVLNAVEDIRTIVRNDPGFFAFASVRDAYRKIKNEDQNSLLASIMRGNLSEVGKDIREDKFGLTWKLISGLSSLCIFPHALLEIFSKVNFNPLADENIRRDPLLLTFALRNLLARLAFYTKLRNTIYTTLKEMNYFACDEQGQEISFNSTFAFVGFNRLLSPNNKTGVSYSSDIDYKLVIDSSKLRQADGSELSAPQVSNVVKALNKAQEVVKPAFDEDAKMLLEVEDFTTRNLEELRTLVGSDEREKNFLASIYNNNIFIAGNMQVYDSFQNLLSRNASELEIAKRTWVQYLGPSDKGSIRWITKTKDLVEFFGIVAKRISDNSNFRNNRDLMNHIIKVLKLNENSGVGKDLEDLFCPKEEVKDDEGRMEKWLQSPKIAKAILKHKDVLSFLCSQNDIKNNLDRLEMFPSDLTTLEDQLTITVKVYAELVDDNVYDPESAEVCLRQIGSEMVDDNTDNWRFSLKYAGCRLNDFYDSVTLEDYKKWCKPRMESKMIEHNYGLGQRVALVINEFSLRMQNFIYQLASVPDKDFPDSGNKTHEDIDALYARITQSRFLEMAVRTQRKNAGNVNLTQALTKLHESLENIKRGIYQEVVTILDTQLKIVIHEAKNLKGLVASSEEQLKARHSGEGTISSLFDGRIFFQSIFNLVFATSKLLNPLNNKF